MCFIHNVLSSLYSQGLLIKKYNYIGLGVLSNLFGGVCDLSSFSELYRLTEFHTLITQVEKKWCRPVESCSLGLKFFTVPSSDTTGFLEHQL